MNTTLLGLIVGGVAGALISRRYAPEATPHGEPQKPNLAPAHGPGEEAGKDYRILVAPDGDSLKFTCAATGKDCTRLEIAPSDAATNRISWDFQFDGQSIVLSQVQFEGGTPCFRVLDPETPGRKTRFADDSIGAGRELVSKKLKQASWSNRYTGLSEIEDGDEFKYSVVVVSRDHGSGTLNVYAADPIVIVRRG